MNEDTQLARHMRLYIGKNHEVDATPVQSIFRLAGNDEDALTYALGFLLAHDQDFCAKLVRRLRIVSRHTLKPDYSVHLQEITGSGFGRRDIVIQDSETRIVLEAKVGRAEPTACQLFKYAKDEKLWKQYKRRGIVALTQVELAVTTSKKVCSKLSEQDIRFRNVQWHEVIGLALSHRPSDGSEVSRYLFEEFIRYIRRDYGMGYYDVEVHIQDLNPLNAEIFTEGWMYVTSLNDKKAPLYFAPYFTQQCPKPGISLMSRVLYTEDIEVAALLGKEDFITPPPSEEHRSRWTEGLVRIRERAKKEKWERDQRLFYYDRPIAIAEQPIVKGQLPKKDPTKSDSKPMPQIPTGYGLLVEELLRLALDSQASSPTTDGA